MGGNIHCDILIAGAGPAGLMAGISAKLHNPSCSIIIAEKMKSPGRKLLITGKGQCNLTRSDPVTEFLSCYGRNGRFLKKSLYAFPPEDLMAFFTQRGCPLTVRDDKKVFPSSLRSQDILNVLTKSCKDLGIVIDTDSGVKNSVSENSIFHITSNKHTYESLALILCCGGKSYPATGSAGDGYPIAETLGHTITPVHPALAPLYCEDFYFSDCAGISFDEVQISVYIEGRKKHQTGGPLLITHNGFSGPAVLHSSRYITGSERIKINFLPQWKEEAFSDELIHSSGRTTVSGFLSRYFPKSFSRALCQRLSLSADLHLSELPKKDRKKMLTEIFRHRPERCTTGSFKIAMVTAGGVSLTHVNPGTMESKICPGLYFAGELLDIDGNTGGYNLQAAFSTAYTAGKSCALSIAEIP